MLDINLFREGEALPDACGVQHSSASGPNQLGIKHNRMQGTGHQRCLTSLTCLAAARDMRGALC